MKVNPITHTGTHTIGYGEDGAPGLWLGVMTDTCETHEWIPVVAGATLTDVDGEIWVLIEREEDAVECWQGPDELIYDPVGPRSFNNLGSIA